MKSRLIRPLLVVLTIASLSLLTQGAMPDVPTGLWQAGPPLNQPRTGAAAVALADGGVLLVGRAHGSRAGCDGGIVRRLGRRECGRADAHRAVRARGRSAP